MFTHCTNSSLFLRSCSGGGGDTFGEGSYGKPFKVHTSSLPGLTGEVTSGGDAYTSRGALSTSSFTGSGSSVFEGVYNAFGRTESETGSAPRSTWGGLKAISDTSYQTNDGFYSAAFGAQGRKLEYRPSPTEMQDGASLLLDGPAYSLNYTLEDNIQDFGVDVYEVLDPTAGLWSAPYAFRSAGHEAGNVAKGIGYGTEFAAAVITGGTSLGAKSAIKAGAKGVSSALAKKATSIEKKATQRATGRVADDVENIGSCPIGTGAANAAAAVGSKNSFAAGTPVLLADGSTKSIEDVVVGDKVVATDPTTGKTSTETVVHLIQGSGTKQMVEVTLADGQVIQATENHPFWDAATKSWTNAGDLTTQSQVETASTQLVAVQSIRAYTLIDTTVYNLTVNGKHTYYVGSAADAVLVHNNSCDESVLPVQVKTKAHLTRSQLDDLAKYNGFKRTKEKIKGQAVYTNGKKFITVDIDQHNGGTWKRAASTKRLLTKETRDGTFDALLNRIGD